MKKVIFTLTVLLCIIHTARSQEVGYTTTDIGAEYNNYPGGNIYKLHIAFNSKFNHSFQVTVGYNSVNSKYASGYFNEKGGGLTGSIGYRYYFTPKPYGFFIGARAEYWKMKMDWTKALVVGETNTSLLVPAIEAGYMFLFNDMFFITPSFTAGSRINLNSNENPVKDGFLSLFGISTGVKF